MCNCVSDIEKKMLSRTVGIGTKHKKVVKATLVSGGLLFGASPSFRTSSIIECELEGQKKPYEQSIIHGWCPFCGIKYPETK